MNKSQRKLTENQTGEAIVEIDDKTMSPEDLLYPAVTVVGDVDKAR